MTGARLLLAAWLGLAAAGVPAGAAQSRDPGLEKNVDMAALPYLMYAFSRQVPHLEGIRPAADAELRYIGDLLLAQGEPNVSRLMVWEVMTWGMLSYAKRLQPAALGRGARSLSLP